MSIVYLIRHGQASFGQENYDQLSDLGKQQSAHLGLALRQRLEGFDVVCLGGMQRHLQTAELCLAAMEQNLSASNADINPAWNEYDHTDILAQFHPQLATANSTTAYIAKQKNPKQAFEKIFNGAINRWMAGHNESDYRETWVEFHQRVTQALTSITEQNKEAKHIAVFTSGGPISLLSQSLLGVPESRLMQLNWTLVNCGVTRIVSTSSRRFVASLNEHVHFEGKHRSLITYK